MPDPLLVLALAEMDLLFLEVAGRLPERPGRGPKLAKAVRRQIEADASWPDTWPESASDHGADEG